MYFELANELKDAGFPQVFPTSDEFYSHDGIRIGTMRAKGNEWALTEFTSGCSIPALTELIAACGDDLWLLARKNEGGWRVTNGRLGSDEIAITGATPSEAVAKFWIALNKK